MSLLINGFKNIEEASLVQFANNSVGAGVLPNDDVYKQPISKGIIDVVNRFSWFSSGANGSLSQAAVNRVPRAYLVEREQILNSQLSQALYFLNAATKGTKTVVDTFSEFSKFLGVTKGGEQDTENVVQKAVDKLQKKVEGVGATSEEKKRLEQNYLSSLIGLYLTKPTGFKYVFPYFDKPPTINNTWGGPSNEGAVNALINTGMDIVEEITSFVNIAQPGVYIQKAKHYTFSEDGPSVTIGFPLFNTVRRGGEAPYKLNYELLWLLAYQNKPYKTSFARNIPPKIYDVQIPGLVNMPYATIANLSIDFVGTVRNKTINIAGLGSLTAPVPDAYNVTIELTSLLSDYANLMAGAGFGVKESLIDNKITVKSPTASTPTKQNVANNINGSSGGSGGGSSGGGWWKQLKSSVGVVETAAPITPPTPGVERLGDQPLSQP